MFYVIVIIAAVLLTSAVNILCILPATLLDIEKIVLSVSLGAIAVIIIDGIFALLIRRLTPKSWFSAGRKGFQVSKTEYQLYRKLKIKTWKDKIPELGGFTGFHKDKLESADNTAYLERFLLESNYGVIIHLANAIFGFFVAFIPPCSSPSIWIPVFAVNFILSMLPVFVLRFNTYTLSRLYQRSLKHSIKS